MVPHLAMVDQGPELADLLFHRMPHLASPWTREYETTDVDAAWWLSSSR
jgi:hypothetical protein